KMPFSKHADIHAAKVIKAKGLAGNVVAKKPTKKISRQKPKPKVANAAVKPTVKQQPEEATRSKQPVDPGAQVREDLDRGVLDTPVLQHQETSHAGDTS